MKKLFVLSLFCLTILLGCGTYEPACTDCDEPTTSTGGSSTGGSSSSGCGNGRTLHKGPKGGCYYINSKGNKVYVDRSCCY